LKWAKSSLGQSSTYVNVALPLNIDVSDPNLSLRWRKWLEKYFDPSPAAQTIGPAIYAAIQDNHCLQIEFFVAPDGGKIITATATNIPDNYYNVGGQYYTLVITIHTNTFDQLGG